eukprot:gene8327-873_t
MNTVGLFVTIFLLIATLRSTRANEQLSDGEINVSVNNNRHRITEKNKEKFGIPPTHTGFLPVHVRDSTCHSLLQKFTNHREKIELVELQMSETDQERFSHDDLIPLTQYIVDDTNGGEGSHYKFSANSIENMVASAGRYLQVDGQFGKNNVFSQTQKWFIEALRKYKHLVERKNAIVWGSMNPWYEAMLLAANANHVTTVEYNKLTFSNTRMTTLQPHELKQTREKKWPRFDVAVSTSSFDHDGLGRYGDPKDPFGDIKAMKIARCLLNPGGILFFSVPIGPDVTVYNLHRRYGSIRLPAILEHWEIVDIIGWESQRLNMPADYRRSYEPIFVLKKTKSGRSISRSEL